MENCLVTDMLAETTVFKLLPRLGFTNVSDIPYATPGMKNGTVPRVKNKQFMTCHGSNGERTVVVDEKGRIWMKDGPLPVADLAIVQIRFPNSSSNLPGLRGEVFNPEHLATRRMNPIAAIS